MKSIFNFFCNWFLFAATAAFFPLLIFFKESRRGVFSDNLLIENIRELMEKT